MKLFLILAQWLINYLKERNGFLSDELKKARDNQIAFNISLNELTTSNVELQSQIYEKEVRSKNLAMNLQSIEQSILAREKDYNEKINNLINSFPDSDVIRLDLTGSDSNSSGEAAGR